jgi:Raf kinase inhibitor-like YbhB/YbcL family protein
MGFALSDMQLTSPAFAQGGAIPKKFTGEGADISPELAWTGVPKGTRSLAVICHDPDAPMVSMGGTLGFAHWLLYNIPASTNGLPEGVKDFTAGRNDFGKAGYGGPMPPSGHGEHRYYFWVMALDRETRLEPDLTLWELLTQIEPLIIGMNRLVGTYQRG